MDDQFDAVLNECLELLRRGVDVSACLAYYPHYADRLRPLLQLAAEIHAIVTPAPSSAARIEGRRRMLAALAQKQARHPDVAMVARHRVAPANARLATKAAPDARFALRLAFAVMIFIAAVTSGTVAASAASLPGDVLYPVKLAAQQAQIALTLDPTARVRLEEQAKAQLRHDIQTAQRAGRQTTVELVGSLERIDGDTWVVSGLEITVKPESAVMGQPRIGAPIVVRGKLPGDGSLVATQLSVADKDQPTPPAKATDAVSPSETPKPTETLEPTETPEPTDTPMPAIQSEPTETPQPEGTVKPDRTPRPTKEPKPSKEPQGNGPPDKDSKDKNPKSAH